MQLFKQLSTAYKQWWDGNENESNPFLERLDVIDQVTDAQEARLDQALHQYLDNEYSAMVESIE